MLPSLMHSALILKKVIKIKKIIIEKIFVLKIFKVVKNFKTTNKIKFLFILYTLKFLSVVKFFFFSLTTAINPPPIMTFLNVNTVYNILPFFYFFHFY